MLCICGYIQFNTAELSGFRAARVVSQTLSPEVRDWETPPAQSERGGWGEGGWEGGRREKEGGWVERGREGGENEQWGDSGSSGGWESDSPRGVLSPWETVGRIATLFTLSVCLSASLCVCVSLPVSVCWSVKNIVECGPNQQKETEEELETGGVW